MTPKKLFEKKKDTLLKNYYANSLAKCLKEICLKEKIKYDKKLYNSILYHIKKTKIMGQKVLPEKVKKNLMPSAWDEKLNRFLTIEEYCEKYGLDINYVKSANLVAHNSSHMAYNIKFFTKEEKAVENLKPELEDIIKKFIKPQVVGLKAPIKNKPRKDFDRLIYTDVHIGMDVNGTKGSPLFKGKWDLEELISRLKIMVRHVIEEQESDLLYIDDLGDYLDGLNGETTRKGHKLPQNMNDKEVFELGVVFKLSLVELLMPYYSKIICNSITDDNHSGVFSYFVNSAVKGILEAKYNGLVEYNIIEEFIGYYKTNNHTFVLSHGKDSGEMKFGLKPFLDSKQIGVIDNYIKENNLYDGNFIEFNKGDSHQAVFDETSTNDFFYYTFPALSPPSNWVKTNFKNTLSGFRMISYSNEKRAGVHKPFYF
jgi:hypothetical protein